MSDIAINPVTRRVQFTGNTGTGPFAFTFNILTSSDIAVYKGSTLLTLTANYSVNINANGTGSVTLTSALVATDVLTIIGGRQLARTTDFVTAGDLLASSLNEQLDSNVIMTQQLDEKFDRSLSVGPGDTFTSLSLPLKDARKGTVLGFNATTGDPEAGPNISSVQSLADVSADIKTLADIQDGTVATNAITNVNTIRANVTTVSGIAGNVTTVAGISGNVTSVAGNATNINTVAGVSANVTTVAGQTTEIGRLGTADAVADMNTLGTADIVSDMNLLGTSTNVSNMGALGPIAGNISTVAGISANVTTVAGQTTNLQNVTDNLSAIQSSPTNAAAAATSATAAANSATAGATSATAAATSATAAAGSATTATTQAGISTTKAGEASTSATAAQTAKTAAETALDEFTDIYLGSKSSAPTTDNDGNALVTGAIYWNSTQDQLYVWDGSAWDPAAFTASGAVTSFNSRTGAVTLTSADITNGSGLLTTGGAMTGPITTNSTFDGVDIATRDAVLTSTTTTANAALPKAGGAVTGNVTFGDSNKAIFGAGSDLEVFHDGSASNIIDTGTGNLFICGSGAIHLMNPAQTEYYASFNDNGAVDLRYDNSIKLSTTSTGIDVTDTINLVGGGLISSDGTGDTLVISGSNAANAGGNITLEGNTATDASQIKFKNGSTEVMRIAGGNVGIGTSSPTSNYGTNLNVHSSATNGAALHLTDGTTGNANTDGFHLISTGGLAYVWNREATATVFATSNTERLRIDLQGNLLVGKTSAAAAGAGLWMYNTGSYGRINFGTSITGTSFPAVFYNNSGAEAGSITYTTTATSYNTSSDYRLKTDAQPMTGASARVQALNPVNFQWISDGTRVDGFLAHEAQAVVPEAVTGTKDAVDADGNPKYQGIDQSKIVPLLTAALQEALTEITALKARVTTLEGA